MRRTIRRGGRRDITDFGAPSGEYDDLSCAQDETVAALLRGERGRVQLWIGNYAEPPKRAHETTLRIRGGAA
jgi:hypothetical protein